MPCWHVFLIDSGPWTEAKMNAFDSLTEIIPRFNSFNRNCPSACYSFSLRALCVSPSHCSKYCSECAMQTSPQSRGMSLEVGGVELCWRWVSNVENIVPHSDITKVCQWCNYPTPTRRNSQSLTELVCSAETNIPAYTHYFNMPGKYRWANSLWNH